jgi:hypothetical protein
MINDGGQNHGLESDSPGSGDDACEAVIEIGLYCKLQMDHCSCNGNAGYYCEEFEHCHHAVAMDLRVENEQVSSIDLSVCSASRKLGENACHYDDLKTQFVSRLMVIDRSESYLYVGCVETIPLDRVEGFVR